MKRRTLQEYMEWLVLGRRVKVNGGEAAEVTQVGIEDSWLVLYHADGYDKYLLNNELVIELAEAQ